MVNGKQIAVLGGGPGGLANAYFIKKRNGSVMLFEASNTVGGNCRTISYENFKFDSGAHRLHDKDKNTIIEIKQLLPDGQLDEIFSPSFIYFNGRFIKFPLQALNLISNLKISVLFKAIFHFIFDRFGFRKVDNFENLVFSKYGRTIANLFLTNYSQKLWGLPTSQLSTKIAGNRLKNLDLKSFVSESLRSKVPTRHMEGSFYYPKEGFGQIADSMAQFIGDSSIALNSRIVEVVHQNDEITGIRVSGGEILHYDHYISSIPIYALLKSLNPQPPQSITDIAEQLKFRHLQLFGFFLNIDQVMECATIYFPDTKYPFTRGYEPKNRSCHMSPEGKTSFVVEYPYFEKMSDQEINCKQKEIQELLIADGFFKQSDIIDTCHYTIPYAYPVLEKGYEDKLEILFRYLSRFKNLSSTGRNGLFEYSWTHNMMINGRKIVKEIFEK